MNAAPITCALCGHRYDPAAQTACRACPLHAGCTVTCCPACGYTTIDVNRSRLAQWLTHRRPVEKTHVPHHPAP